MSNFSFVEDAFVRFYQTAEQLQIIFHTKDVAALHNFYTQMSLGNQLTVNQADFVISLLHKYQTDCIKCGLDYTQILSAPKWKTTFRKLDLSKKIFVEISPESELEICVKFPFSIKSLFEKEFAVNEDANTCGKWDQEHKLRRFRLYDINVVQLNEFVEIHGFQIDETFKFLRSHIEEIWAENDNLLPYCIRANDKIEIFNYTADAKIYFDNHFSNLVNKDMLLAKHMGYLLQNDSPALNDLERICASNENYFWCKTQRQFLQLFLLVDGLTAVVLDRNTQDILKWLTDFLHVADTLMIPRSEIKVCFRESTGQDTGLNSWIKTQEVGGAIGQSKILIFLHKPAKWLFKEQHDVKIVAVNNFTPIIEPLTHAWVDTHPCVLYISDIRPTSARKKTIVDL